MDTLCFEFSSSLCCVFWTLCVLVTFEQLETALCVLDTFRVQLESVLCGHLVFFSFTFEQLESVLGVLDTCCLYTLPSSLCLFSAY